MAKKPRQKQKLLYLQKILLERTDENHGMTVNEIIDALAQYDISAERKSIYEDLRILESFGLDICSEKTKTVKYYIGSRDFQISELKLLVDAIQSSKFVTEKKSMELIKKLENLASRNDAQLMQRHVYISNRVKTINETIYYNVDDLHNAINKDRVIEFFYNQWSLDFNSAEKIKFKRRHDGEKYVISPWALCWDDENYYLIGFDHQSKQIRHYRVDKMEKIKIGTDTREGKFLFEKFDLANYTKSTFSMFAGKTTRITLSVDNDLIGVIVDRFGKNICIIQDKNIANHFKLDIDVILSNQFYGWIFALGDKVKILSPQKAVDEYNDLLKTVIQQYNKEVLQ